MISSKEKQSLGFGKKERSEGLSILRFFSQISLTNILLASGLLVALLFWVSLSFYKTSQERKANILASRNISYERELVKRGVLELAREMGDFSQKIDLLNASPGILKNHIRASNLFGFLEAYTLANVHFDTLQLDTSTNTAELTGKCPSYQALAQQIKVYNSKSEDIQSLKLGKVSLSTEGDINFSLTLYFKQGFFIK